MGCWVHNIKVSARDVFSISGPTHLSAVDWNCPHHRRSIAASLVQATYVLEIDRQEKRQGSEALAPVWWEFFHFELIRPIVDRADSSIFGAVFKFTPQVSLQNPTVTNAPKFVIAFRGTLTKIGTVSRDLNLDLKIIWNKLHQSSRSKVAIKAVDEVVSDVGSSNGWLAGHSLGAAIATLAGKRMAKFGKSLEAFLFNPPLPSAPIEWIKDEKVKHGIRIGRSVMIAALAKVLKPKQERTNDENSFVMLSSWVPCLFVNRKDHICSEYIGYFQHRNKMEEIGAGSIGRLATQSSRRDLVLGHLFGKESDPLHLLPSANLTVNLHPSRCPIEAHGIHQWWQQDLYLETSPYRYQQS